MIKPVLFVSVRTPLLVCIMRFLIHCSCCPATFKTGTSFSKHLLLKHPDQQHTPIFKGEDGKELQPPQPLQISNELHPGYLKWLTVLQERINETLPPDVPGNYKYSSCNNDRDMIVFPYVRLIVYWKYTAILYNAGPLVVVMYV